MKLNVDQAQRYAKMRAHTATHLLHAEIAKVIPQTQQAGSFVDNDYLRFDFQSDKLLTDQELQTIEKNINQQIYQAHEVTVEESSMTEAKKLGAKAFFEDKYGDVVRVVCVGKQEKLSIELCGGTHVPNTKDIGAFLIISQEAVASGIKRIVAITGPKVGEQALTERSELDALSQKLGVNRKQFPDKLEKTLKDFAELQEKYTSLQGKLLQDHVSRAYQNATGNNDFAKIIKMDGILATLPPKEIANQAREINESVIVLYKEDGSFILCAKNTSAKEIAKKHELRGGGNNEVIQGKDSKILDLIN